MSSLTTYREAVLAGAASLRKCGVESPDYDSRQLMLHAASMNDTEYLMRSGEAVPSAQLEAFEVMLHRRMKREPLQHILGQAYFYGRAFNVNANVLVPRFDTEGLVENALKTVKDGDAVLDMCTGSGCIIITLALERNLSVAVGCDKSGEALSVARGNWDKLSGGVGSNITFLQGDLFQALGDDYRNFFDCIVSNPPYIESSVIDTLSDEVKNYDPLMALDGGDDGLVFYREITGQANNYLKDGGALFFEIGAEQGKAVAELMEKAGYSDIEIIKDLAGLDRVVRGTARQM
jgi:release factor glutamine methyltransferase